MPSNLWNITVDVSRFTGTQGTFGEVVRTYATVFTDLAGRLQKLKSNEVVFNDKRTVISDYVFFCDVGAPIETTDRLLYDSRVFEVGGKDNANQMGNHLRVELLEIV